MSLHAHRVADTTTVTALTGWAVSKATLTLPVVQWIAAVFGAGAAIISMIIHGYAIIKWLKNRRKND